MTLIKHGATTAIDSAESGALVHVWEEFVCGIDAAPAAGGDHVLNTFKTGNKT